MRDHAAEVAACVRANSADLLRYVERRVAPPGDAAAAFGACVEVLWRRRRRLPADPHEARLWAFGVARNAVFTANRAARRGDIAQARLAEALARAPEPIPGDDALDVRAAIAALPRDQAELIRLVYWDGFTVAEAGQICGVGASTARSRHATAKARLRAALA